MSPSEVCATGTGIGVARALILWPELVTLGARCSRWPSWLWPLIVDGTIILATLGIVALAPYRDQLGNRGFLWVVLGIAALVSVGGNLLHAWLATDQLASWTRGGGETWRQGADRASGNPPLARIREGNAPDIRRHPATMDWRDCRATLRTRHSNASRGQLAGGGLPDSAVIAR